LCRHNWHTFKVAGQDANYIIYFRRLGHYTSTGDGINVASSAGTYTYSTNGNQGVASIVDSVLGNGSFALTFTSSTEGTFVATAASDPASKQSGSFVQL
jgi:hypothetical protein